ncbi:hypothetical protein ACFLQI_01865 [Candidatus Undinarchaeota archaeon]
MSFKGWRDKESLETQLDTLAMYCREIYNELGGGTFNKDLKKAFDNERVDERFSTFHNEVIMFLDVLAYDDEILSEHLEEVKNLPDPEGDYRIWLYNMSSIEVALKRALEAEDFERCIKGCSQDRQYILSRHIVRLSYATEKLFEKLTDVVEKFRNKENVSELKPILYGAPDEIPKDADKKLWKEIKNGKNGKIVKCPYDPEHDVVIGWSRCIICSKREGKKENWIDKPLPRPKKKR